MSAIGDKIDFVNASAMVLCAGLGTRLRPLTDELPKPLVPVGDRPLLEHIALALRAAGFDRLAVNAHHLSQELSINLEGLQIALDVVVELELRGTGGGIAGARAGFGAGPVLVWNGDILTEPPISDLLVLARETGGLCLSVMPKRTAQGNIGLGAGGRVVRLRGERFGEELESADYMGVCGVGERCLATLPDVGCLFDDWALPELQRGGQLIAVGTKPGFWQDAGDLLGYLHSNRSWLTLHAQDSGGSWVGPGARVERGVTLVESVVGRGARVCGSGRLEGCVVWPGAIAVAPLSDAIVTGKGRVVRVKVA